MTGSADSAAWWRSVLVEGHGELESRSDAAETYLVLPSRTHPRIVVDADASTAVADVVRRAVAQRRLPAALASVLVASGGLRLIPSRWSVAADPGSETLREHLGRVIDAEISLSITVGPPRVNRKPVVRCYAHDRLVAVAKLGPDDHTARMLDNEAHWLGVLADDPIDGLITPGLLHHGRYGSSVIVVMSVLPLESDSGVAFDDMPDALLERFTTRYRSDVSLATSSWFRGLPERCAGVEDEVVRTALEVVADYRGAELGFEAWHGDWSPWNLGRTGTGHWCLWDWERAGTEVPRGFDQVHRHRHYGAGLDAGRSALRDLGMSSDQIELTVGLYLLELAARCIEGGAWTAEADNPTRRELHRSVTRLRKTVGWER